MRRMIVIRNGTGVRRRIALVRWRVIGFAIWVTAVAGFVVVELK